MKASIASTRNQKVVQDGVKKSKAKQIAGMPLRMATMPFGMLHDLSRGGIIQVGKNFIPRCKNAIMGDSLVSHADIKKKKPKANPKEGEKKDTKPNTDTPLNNDNHNAETDSNRTNESIKPGEETNNKNTESDRVDPVIKKEDGEDENNT